MRHLTVALGKTPMKEHVQMPGVAFHLRRSRRFRQMRCAHKPAQYRCLRGLRGNGGRVDSFCMKVLAIVFLLANREAAVLFVRLALFAALIHQGQVNSHSSADFAIRLSGYPWPCCSCNSKAMSSKLARRAGGHVPRLLFPAKRSELTLWPIHPW